MITGRDKGRAGAVHRGRRRPVRRRGHQHGQEAPAAEPAGSKQGGIIEKEMPLHVVEGGDLQSGVEESRSRRLQDAHRRQEGAFLQVERRDARRLSVGITNRNDMASRLQEIYRETVVPELRSELGLKNTMQVPRITKITVNMGVGEAVADNKVMDAAVADMAKITGQKPLVIKSKKSDRVLQGARRSGDRLQGDAARRAHVRVPRPSDQHRDAAHPRFPRRLAALLRRPRQLQPRREGADHLSPRFSTTRSIRCGEWTSPSPRRRGDDKQGRALLEAFNFPFRK